MAGTTFTVRQFNSAPSETWPVSSVTGTYLVQGTISVLYINNTRTNLAADNLFGNQWGWFPGPDTTAYGIIVQGNDASVANTASDGRSPVFVTCWGWPKGASQGDNDTAFISLAGNILGATYGSVAAAKSALQTAGMYYQYPVGFAGQSPNTGTGSDV